MTYGEEELSGLDSDGNDSEEISVPRTNGVGEGDGLAGDLGDGGADRSAVGNDGGGESRDGKDGGEKAHIEV